MSKQSYGADAIVERVSAPRFSFVTRCFDKHGRLKWIEIQKNLVVDVGGNDMLTQYFTGSAYTAAFYGGLVDGTATPTYAAGDTMASHAGWTENSSYSQGARPTLAFGTAASKSLSSSSALVFSMNANYTVAGLFVCTNSTIGGTTGTLYSASSFSASRSGGSGDTINVSYSVSV